jgi:hypothetical protein
MINKKKRGMSEVLVAVLMILLVTSTIAAVFIWNKQIFSSLTSSSQTCTQITLTTGDFCYESKTIMGQPKRDLKFNVRNELNTTVIHGFLIFIDDNYGNTQTLSTLSSTSVVGFETKSLTSDYFSDNGISNVRIIPQLKEKDKVISCDDKKITLKWATVPLC